MKSRAVMVGYIVFIKENLQRQPDVCNLDDIAELIHVVTNHGLIKPRDKPVHFTVTYGNTIDLNQHLPGYDWVLLDSCYVFHRGARQVTPFEIKQWHTFFSKLGVLNYLAVEKKIKTVKVDELDATPWVDIAKFWTKPADGVYKIHDHVCREFDELVQADLTNLQGQRQNLLKVLQQEWSNYSRYTKALVFNQDGIKLADTESTFAMHLKMSEWLPSTGVTGENEGQVVFRSPGQVFFSTPQAKELLGDHVPYLISGDQRDESGMLQFMGVKSSNVIDVEFLTSKLLAWCCNEPSLDISAKTPFVTSLSHIIKVYEYLERYCRPQEFTTLFSDHRVVFVPSRGHLQSPENALQGQFVHKSLVYCKDPTGLLGMYDVSPRSELGTLYPCFMEDFFLRKVGVDAMPSIKEYAQLLVECANDITLPDNSRIKTEILPLYRILGYKCLRSNLETVGQAWDLSASGANQQPHGVDPASAKFVKSILEDQAVYPTLGNKWVTLKETPLICDSHSSELERLFSDKKEVNLLNLGDRDRLGRVVQDVQGSSANQQVRVFLEACGIEMLSDCIKEELITQLTQPSLQLQLFLHKVCPYVQLYMSAKRDFNSVYKKLSSEINIAAKLKVMRFMEAKTLEKLYRFKHDPNVFAKETVDCGLEELMVFNVASSISQNLRQSSSVRREVAKLFSCGSVEIQNDLFTFLGSLLLELGNKKTADDKEVDETICKDLNLAPLQDGEEPWKVPKPFIPEVVKPAKVKTVVPNQKPLQPTASALLEDDGAGIHSWPPKSCAYGPQLSTKGSQAKSEEVALKMWPPPEPPASIRQAPFIPHGPGQPTTASINEGTPLQQGNPDGTGAAYPPSINVGGGSHPAQPIGQGSNRGSRTMADYIQPPLEGATVKFRPPQETQLPDDNPLMAAPAEEGMEASSEGEERWVTSDEDVSSNESREESGEEEDEEQETEIQEDEHPPHPEFHSPPSVQRLAAASYPSSGSVKKFFVPPYTDGDPLEVEFEDLAHGPALLSNLTDVDLPVSEDVDTTEIARWGENLVYLYLVQNAAEQGSSEVKVHWVNQDTESGEPYDIVITDGSTNVYVEVKSTIKDRKQVIEISPKEVAFAQEKGQLFHLYRVFNVGNAKGVRLCRLRDLSHRMDTKQVRLFMYL